MPPFYSSIQAKLILLLTPLIIYFSTIGYDYAVDDHSIITSHDQVLSGLEGIDDIFTSNYRHGVQKFNDGLYRPLSLAVFAIFEEIAPGSPFPGHALNIGLYTLLTFLVFSFIKKLPISQANKIAFWTALFFAVLPIHTEVAANIKSLDELLSITFGLTTCLLAIKYLQQKRTSYLALASVTFSMALLSKESSLTYLAIVPLIAYIFFPKTSFKTTIFIMAPLVIVGGLWLYIRQRVLNSMPPLDPEVFGMLNNPLTIIDNYPDQLVSALNVQLTGLYKLFIPYPLLHDYSYNYFPIIEMGSLAGVLLLLFFAAIAAITVWGIIKRKYWAFGLAFYGITLSPVANVLFQNSTIFGERLLFTPSLGIVLTVVVLISQLKLSKRWVWIPAALAVVYGALSFDRQRYWKDNETLFSQDIQHLEASARGNYNYATILYMKYKDGERVESLKQEALLCFDRAISIYPDYLDAWNNKGSLHIFAREYQPAEEAFLKAIEIQPLYGKAYFNLAVVYQETQRYKLAAEYYQKSIDHNIANADAYYGLGYNLGFMNEMNGARAAFEKVLEKDPKYAKAYIQLGKIDGQSGKTEEAIQAFQKSISINDQLAEAHFYLGITYLNLGQNEKGLTYLQTAQRIEPGFNNVQQIIADVQNKMKAQL